MSRDDTHDAICLCLEEYAHQEIEVIGEQILAVIGILGDDLLDHLDPPMGLRRWLDSHGLSLVATHNPPPPAVWDALQEEDEEDVAEGEILEDGQGGLPVLQVGDYVEYSTRPSGPRGQSSVGAGVINAITSEGWVIVQDSPTHEQWLNPEEGDRLTPMTRPGSP